LSKTLGYIAILLSISRSLLNAKSPTTQTIIATNNRKVQNDIKIMELFILVEFYAEKSVLAKEKCRMWFAFFGAATGAAAGGRYIKGRDARLARPPLDEPRVMGSGEVGGCQF
jgi:hypothetical protein